MSLLGGFARFLAIEPAQPVNYSLPQSEFPPMDVQLHRVLSRSGTRSGPSIVQALSVPAIYRAVTLIANTVGALSLEAYRQGVRLEQPEAPRLIVRPNPFTVPREFYRDTSYSMATRGEAWWWIAARDSDDAALSLYPMPAHEVKVEVDERDLLRPKITWRDRRMRNEDVVQIVMSREPGALRGTGPLQACGASVSVAVEAQGWAADFFAAGGAPSVVIKSAVGLSEDEALTLKGQWNESPPNTARVIDPSIESVEDFSMDPAKAQLTDTRRYSNGEAAQMFGIPGSLLDHFEPGASLTYQNVSQEYDKFVRACLWVNYLEPIEQAMSDLLTRATVARFNLDGLLRADIKTRYDVYESGVSKSGMLSVEEARRMEGLAPGDVERAPVPLAPPQAIPDRLPIQLRSAAEVRCASCGWLLAEMASPPYRFRCRKCKAITEDATVLRSADAPVAPELHITIPLAITTPGTVIERGAVQVEAAQVTHTIEAGAVQVTNDVAPAATYVEMAPAVVGVDQMTRLQARFDEMADRQADLSKRIEKASRPRRATPERDERGRIIGIVSELEEVG